jgi:hypothetical protein
VLSASATDGLPPSPLGASVARIGEGAPALLLAVFEAGLADDPALRGRVATDCKQIGADLPEQQIRAVLRGEWNGVRLRHEPESWRSPGAFAAARDVVSQEARAVGAQAIPPIWPGEGDDALREVREAPAVVAFAAASGVRLKPVQLFALRECREFDPHWFEFALKLGIGPARRAARRST